MLFELIVAIVCCSGTTLFAALMIVFGLFDESNKKEE